MQDIYPQVTITPIHRPADAPARYRIIVDGPPGMSACGPIPGIYTLEGAVASCELDEEDQLEVLQALRDGRTFTYSLKGAVSV